MPYMPDGSPVPPNVWTPALFAVVLAVQIAIMSRWNAVWLEGGTLAGPTSRAWRLRSRIPLARVDAARTRRRNITDILFFQTRVWSQDGDYIVINHAVYDRAARDQILRTVGASTP